MALTLDESESRQVTARLKAIVETRRLLHAEVAAKAEMSVRQVGLILAGKTRIRKGSVVRLAEAVGVPATYLFHGGALPPATENTREPMSIMVGEGPGGGYGQTQPPPGGITMAQAMEVIATQMNVPIDKVRQLVLSGLVRSETENKKKG